MSDPAPLAKAIALAERVGHVLVATADAEGLPHIAAAQRLAPADEGAIAVAAWFCPGTVANVEQNKKIAIAVWDPVADAGYQLLGNVESSEVVAMLDGYAPEAERTAPPPQAERRLIVRVSKILRFSHAPHSDAEDPPSA